MAVQYQITVHCKARAASGAVVDIPPGSYSVVGDEPGSRSVRLVREARELEITHAEFQRLKAAAVVKRV
jgi:hypothetical protein